ncbi:MAG: hypothetical protein K0R65_2278 [Crocinitomicaceae bacterium]|jgi:hypothetical protein|nr:hypothetical protein [Crocinitomicaceae bacterium]
MKKQYLLSYCFFAFSFGVFSQKEQSDQLASWIDEHPDVIFIEETNLKNFSDEELAKFSGKYIVFNNEIGLHDIYKYDPSFQEKADYKNDSETPEIKQANTIKDWMGKHQHVKVVTRSEFNAQPIEVQREYAEKKCLILNGEKITVEDINNYQY